ncbi:MAG: thiol:disulfide interchange protein DsbA/DsbL [Gammaproteobacteria bacterium]|nr:thiol:disulfide interchange protein DsbA/DsbL [Gammaproteobacteria bacterium]MDH5617385.1 thiol:disulfide interchange protein DsbA/DsbL [Gammaproteobacteria bacterium]
MTKHFFWIAALLLTVAACSKEEQPAPVAQDAAVEAPAPEPVTEPVATEEATTETLEIVEESAAEEEAEDEPIVLAVADTADASAREWKYQEGKHYFRLVPTQPTVGGADKIEVAESFMYSCPHCFTLEPYINKWAAEKDPAVRFVRIPATWNQAAVLHAQIYYTQDILGRNGALKDPDAFHLAVFTEFHQRGNRLTSETVIKRLFMRYGVSEDDFNKTWNSFEVNTRLRLGGDLVRRYGIAAVPTIVVNGKYRTSASDAGGYDQLIELIDELTVREGLR